MSKFLQWKFKQKAEDNPKVVDLYIYGDVEGDREDWWGDKISSDTSATTFKKQLAQYCSAEQINLYVNTCGGDVIEAMAIRNQLKRCTAKVTAFVDGIAASAGAFILTGCDEVKMYSNTMQMIHNMWTCVCGNANELRKEADDLDKMMEGNRQAFLEKSNGKLTEDKLIELLDGESWLTAQECFDYGLCDEIIEENVDMSKAEQLLQHENLSLQQRINSHKALKQLLNEEYKPVEQHIEPKEPPKQLNNYQKLRQKFMKEGMNNE